MARVLHFGQVIIDFTFALLTLYPEPAAMSSLLTQVCM